MTDHSRSHLEGPATAGGGDISQGLIRSPRAERPALDPWFCPLVLWIMEFNRQVGSCDATLPLSMALERESGLVSRYDTRVFDEAAARGAGDVNQQYAQRLLKFLLWQRGGWRVRIYGPSSVVRSLQVCYGPGGTRSFDATVMGEVIYGRPMQVIECRRSHLPKEYDVLLRLGGHLDGCRVGFDLGASDVKVVAVNEGETIFEEEAVWEPSRQSSPAYHFRVLVAALRRAAKHLPRLDAIGGSAAGVFVDGEVRISSLFRGVPTAHSDSVRQFFGAVAREMGVPLEIVNDGDVAALAGAMRIGDGGVLGLALGSSLAAGYVDLDGNLTGWLNELAFCPIDINSNAAVDEWSGDRGCGGQYLSQQGVFRLSAQAGIPLPRGVPDAEVLKHVQQRLEAGCSSALHVWQSLGTYLGYAIAQYCQFYHVRHVLVLGRCTSGSGGEIILERARDVLETEFREVMGVPNLHLPDPRLRRVGQAIAAASIPVLG